MDYSDSAPRAHSTGVVTLATSPTDIEKLLEGPDPNRDLGRRSVQAGAFAVAGQFAQFGLTVVAAVILARLLTPADFGVVAIGMTVIEFVNLMLDLGLPSSVQYQKRITKAQIDTLFWLNLAAAIVLAAGVAILGPILARLYDQPRLALLMPVLACSLLFAGAAIQFDALLRRQMRFGTLAAAAIAGTTAGVVASLALAFSGAGYWALVAHTPIEYFVRSTWICAAGGWRPGPPRWRTGLWPTLWYGGDVVGNRLINFVGKGVDRILISFFSGASAVGLYSVADRWTYGTQQMIFGRLIGVALTGFSRAREDVDRYRNYYRRGMGLLWTFLFPVFAGIALEARDVMALLAGAQWDDAAPILRWMSIAALALCVNHTTKWTLLAEGRSRTQLVWGIAQSVVTAACIAVAAQYGVVQVAMAYALATLALTPAAIAVWLRESTISWSDVALALARPAAATLVMAGASALLPVLSEKPGLSFAGAVAILAPVYVAAWVALPGGRTALRDLTDVLSAFARKKSPAQ